MLVVIIAFHVILCFLLMVVILLQSSKGGGLSGAFGGAGGGMGTVFGGRGAATFLSKATVVLATLFFLSNITQGLIIKRQPTHKSLVRQEMEKQGKESQSAADLLPPIEGEKKPSAMPAQKNPGKTAQSSSPSGSNNAQKSPKK